jgi:hypothetical protein
MVKTNKNKIFFAKTRSKKMSKESSFLVSSTGSSKTQETENKIDSPKGNPLLISISITLMDVISNNHLKEHYKHKLKLQSKHNFTSKTIPKISFGDYITRVLNYTQINDSTLIMALVYMDRFCKNRKILLTEFNLHRIFFSALLVAIKYNEDIYYSNLYYAKIGGLKLKKLNKLEAEFLSGISFQLFVDENVYEQYESKLIYAMMDNNDDNKFSFLTQGALLEY